MTSLKLVNNWIHSNTDAGLQVDSGATLGGVVTIQGNLFKVNGGMACKTTATATLDARTTPGVRMARGGRDALAERDLRSLDLRRGLQRRRSVNGRRPVRAGVNETTSFNVDLKVDGDNLYGLGFEFAYDPAYLTLNGRRPSMRPGRVSARSWTRRPQAPSSTGVT